MGEPEQPSAANESIRQIQRTATALATRLKPLSTVRAGSANALGDLERALDALGDTATFAAALQDTADQGRELLQAWRAQRADLLRLAMAGFIRGVEPDRGARETAVGWRVGRLALELKPDDGTLRVSYNRQQMTGWMPVAEAADVERIYKDAEALLEKAELPIDVLTAAIGSSYDHLASRLGAAPGQAPGGARGGQDRPRARSHAGKEAQGR